MKRIILIIIGISLLLNAYGQIATKKINDRSVISLSIENLVSMSNMNLNEWKSLMSNHFYSQEGISGNEVLYTSGVGAYMSHVGGQFFSKSFVKPLVEYTLSYQNTHYLLKEEVVDFISSIANHYVETRDAWSYYLLRYDGIIYQVAILGDNSRTRIVLWKED